MSFHCCACGAILTEENTYTSTRETGHHICKTCCKERAKKWAKEHQRNDPEYLKRKMEYNRRYRIIHRDYLRKYLRDYLRANYLIVNGKNMKVKKRPRPQNCEVCEHFWKMLAYHHWDDDKPHLGVWVCRRCHFVAELTDTFPSDAISTNVLVQKYRVLKAKINNS